MRMLERTLTEVELLPRVEARDSLGGRAEAFAESGTRLRASCLPLEGSFAGGERGAVAVERLRLMVPADAPARVGDAVRLGQRRYRIHDLRHWTAHLELDCEALPCAVR